MLVAKFFRGPFDGEQLILPTEKPWPRFVIPRFEPITIEYFYLLAGEEDEVWCYLFDEFSGVI